ncbi:MAG: nucleotide sugar dehydrogenase [Thermoplasmatota archaeon]
MAAAALRSAAQRLNPPPSNGRRTRAKATLTKAARLDPDGVAVVGLGYVGLPTAIAMAKAGFHVRGVDLNARVIRLLRDARSPIPDSCSDAEIAGVMETGRFESSQKASDGIPGASLVVVCVPTPVDDDHQPDLGPLEGASAAIGRSLSVGSVVSFESTTFPGCTEEVCIPILEAESGLHAGRDFGVAYCPERLCPGDSAHGPQSVTRVLGALDGRSYRIAHAFYSRGIGVPIHKTSNIRTAEASKVLENVQRDVNIALINEFALACPSLGLDVQEVIAAAATKFNFLPLQPGPGVGGHCIPVDPYYLINAIRRGGVEPRMMVTARLVNDATTQEVANATLDGLGPQARLGRVRIALLGLAFKGGIEDCRESPSLALLQRFRHEGVLVSIHDPRVEPATARRLTGLDSTPLRDTVRRADAIVLATDHPEFRTIDWAAVAAVAAPKALVVDARRLVEPSTVRNAGLRYWGIGHPARGSMGARP